MITILDVLNALFTDGIDQLAEDTGVLHLKIQVTNSRNLRNEKRFEIPIQEIVNFWSNIQVKPSIHQSDENNLVYLDSENGENNHYYSEIPVVQKNNRASFSRRILQPIETISENEQILYSLYTPSFRYINFIINKDEDEKEEFKVLILRSLKRYTRRNSFLHSMNDVEDENNTDSIIQLDQDEFSYFKDLFHYEGYENFNKIDNFTAQQFLDALKLSQILDIIISQININLKTLKIVSKDNIPIDSLKNRASSFSFVLAYNNNIPFAIPKSIAEFIGQKITRRNRMSDGNIEPPRKMYEKNLVNLYCLAMSSESAFVQYIYFYHILEFFFTELFIKYVSKEIYDQMTDPGFSYNDNRQVYSLAEEASKLINIKNSGNELKSLVLVLNKFIPNFDDFKKEIDDKKINNIKYEAWSPEFLGREKLIQWTDKDFHNSIAKRIYSVRNSLVHAKSSEKTYRQQDNEEELWHEVLLIKTAAEFVIKNSTEKLE